MDIKNRVKYFILHSNTHQRAFDIVVSDVLSDYAEHETAFIYTAAVAEFNAYGNKHQLDCTSVRKMRYN